MSSPMSKCDVCGAPTQAGNLTELKEEFRVEGIRWMCKQCNGALDSVLAAVDDAINKMVKRTRKGAVQRGIEALSKAFSELVPGRRVDG